MEASILNKQKAHLLFNVGGNYPDAPLILVIWNDVGKQFNTIPEDIFEAKDVYIYGIILYKDKPEIVISNPNQIQESIKADGN